jgi:hypothetical protein
MPDGTQVRFPDEMPKEQIRDMISSKFTEVAPKKETLPDIAQMPKVDVPQYSGWEIAGDAVKGFGKGVGVGLERVLSGLTLGGYDWASDKLGLGSRERAEELKRVGGTPMKVALAGTEIIGGMLPITKGAKVLKGVGGMVLTGTGAGALSSGFSSDFDPTQMAVGGTIGGVASGTIGLAGKGISKAFGKRSAVNGVKRGLENAVESDKGTSVLSTAVGTNKKIANEVLDKAPEALEEINARASRTLQKGLGKGVNVSDEMAKAKRAYADFIDENKANQVIKGKFTPEEYQKNLKNWFEGSQVVDETGKPLKLYHGTDADFDVFDITKGRQNMDIQGSFFSPYELDARGYGPNVKEVYLNIKNPADEGTAFSVLKKYQGQNGAGIKAREELQRMGYDGVFNGYDEYIAFSPKQIKSVQNTGAFSKSPSISDKDFIKLPTSKDLGLTDLSTYQQKALDDAWTMGANRLKPNEKIGSLKHLDEMKKQLNKMISDSRTQKATGIGLEDTKDTLDLREVKANLKGVMEKSGLSGISQQYARAKGLQNAYDMGLKFNPNDIKMRNLNFNPDERSAFAQGLVEKITMNPESRNIAGNVKSVKGALRKVLGENADATLKELESLDKSYERIVGLGRKAMTKTGRADTSGIFLREQIESPTSLYGTIGDYVRSALSGNRARGASEYLLNPAKRLRPSRYERAVKPTLMEILSIEAPKLNRAIQGEE